jgi:hypothetical protein
MRISLAQNEILDKVRSTHYGKSPTLLWIFTQWNSILVMRTVSIST